MFAKGEQMTSEMFLSSLCEQKLHQNTPIDTIQSCNSGSKHSEVSSHV